MTNEAQRIAIAQAYGLRVCTNHAGNDDGEVFFSPEAAEKRRQRWPMSGLVAVIPDYLNDLNAIHEAEKVLGGNNLELFVGEVCRVLDRASADGKGGDDEFNRIHATAAQRAEAFLRTLNLWDDSK